MITRSLRSVSFVVVLAGMLTACDAAPPLTESAAQSPTAPLLKPGGPGGGSCDTRDATGLARDYFPGGGKNSPEKQALALIGEMDDACEADDQPAYLAGWFDLAALIESQLEAAAGGDPVAGDGLMWELMNVQAPGGEAVFDPCAGAASCSPWDGHPERPSFVAALSPGGAWSVVTTGAAAVCSGHLSPCSNVDPSPTEDGDTFGVEPSVSWEGALHGRTSLLYGNPLFSDSPTGESQYGNLVKAYAWNLIPNPDEFGAAAALKVGLCSLDEATFGEAVMQKGAGTILQEVALGFCPSQVLTARANPFGEALRWLARGSLAAPAPLFASVVGSMGPGGSAGGFSDFFAVEVPVAATFRFTNPPVDARKGQPFTGADGNPVSVEAITTSVQSPIENAQVTISVQLNNGLIPSGNGLQVDPGAETNITCQTQTAVCTGFTQADEEGQPGTLELPLLTTKTGVVRICVTGQLTPLEFDTVCSEKINVRP